MEILEAFKIIQDKYPNSAYVALTGSHQYGLANEQSDFDFKVGLLPTLHDLLFEDHKAGSITKVNGEIDIQYMSVVAMVKGGLKHNMSFIEVWLAKHFRANEACKELKLLFQDYLPMNPYPIILGCRGMALQLWSEALADEQKFFKKAANAFYISCFLLNYLDTGKLSYEYELVEKAREIKRGEVAEKHIKVAWEALDQITNTVIGPKNEPSEYLTRLDKRKSKMYEELKSQIISLTKDMCRGSINAEKLQRS